MLKLSDIRKFHLELTEKCNARCPLCLRTNPRGLAPQPYIKNAELSLKDIRSFLPAPIKNQLKQVHLCGNYGDPIMAKDCLEIIDYLSSDQCAVSLSTNGAVKTEQWWSRLGKVLKRHPQSRVDFHIDGLKDTNSFYRRGSQFDRIMTNAAAFIRADGRANWEFIPFKHNEHQIETARDRSKKMGFARFTVKNSNRWFNNKKQKIAFISEQGETLFLEAPTSVYQPHLARSRTYDPDNRPSDPHISCLALREKEIYVSCEGLMYPCCWTARFARNIYLGRKTKDGFAALFKSFDGKTCFDLRQTTIETALNSEFFHQLEELWQKDEPAICYRKCAKQDQPTKVKLSHQ